MDICIYIKSICDFIVTIIAEIPFSKFENTLYAFLSALLGVMIGSYITKRQDKKERIDKEKRLRKDLNEFFQRNISLIDQCIRYLNKKKLPNYYLDVNSINNILFSGKNFFKNEKEYNNLHHQRYQLEHINSKIHNIAIIYYTLVSNATTSELAFSEHYYSTKDELLALYNDEYKSLLDHLKIARGEVLTLLKSL